MGILVFIISLILGTVLFLILELINKLPSCGLKKSIISWAFCCIGAWIILLLLGKFLVGLLVLVGIILIGYVIVACLKD
jgi:hypothetical protein